MVTTAPKHEETIRSVRDNRSVGDKMYLDLVPNDVRAQFDLPT